MNVVNTFAPTPRARLIAATVLGAIVVWIAAGTGLWLLTPLVGCALGLFFGGREGFGGAAAASFAGWAIPLAIRATNLSIGPTAAVVGGIFGLGPHNGTVVIVATPILGVLLGLAGAWIGTATRNVVREVNPRLRPAPLAPAPPTTPSPTPRQPDSSRPTHAPRPSTSTRQSGSTPSTQRTYPARRSGSKTRKK